jgi:hypothetical protein
MTPRAADSDIPSQFSANSKKVLGTDHAALAQHGSDDHATPTQAGYRQRPWMSGRASELQAKSVSMCGRRCTSQQKSPRLATGPEIIRWGKADVSREASLPPVVTMVKRHYLKASEYKAQGGGVAELCPRRDRNVCLLSVLFSSPGQYERLMGIHGINRRGRMSAGILQGICFATTGSPLHKHSGPKGIVSFRDRASSYRKSCAVGLTLRQSESPVLH